MKFSLNIKNVSIKVKIFAVVLLLVSALVLSSIYALSAMNQIGEELVAIAETDIPLTKVVTEITLHQLEQAINFERALRFGEQVRREPIASRHFKEAIQKFRQYSHKIEKEMKQGEAMAEKAMVTAHSEEEYNEFNHVNTILKKVEKEHKEYTEHAELTFALVTQNKMHEAFEFAEKVEKEEEGIDHELENLLLELERFTEAAAKTAEHNEQSAFSNLIIISILATVFSLLVALIIVNGILRGLKRAVNTAEQIATGNLTQEVDSNSTDEVGVLLSALGVMRDKLYSMILNMSEAATELAAASEELSTVSEETDQGIHSQQGEIQQAATAMTEMTAAVQEVARNAQLTSGSASEASQEAQQGQQVVKSTVDSIQSLAGVVENTTTVIQQVAHDSDNIGSVLDVIKGIAEQTNLLALNAAIEAARAGEQGRGFAVVADEVRTLAQRTQESTAEIEGMITRLQASSSNAVTAMESGREQVSLSVEEAMKAGSSLEAITRVVAQIDEMNTQIAGAAEEQTSVAEEVNQNVNVISQVAEQNAAAVHQITASSEELSRMAQNLSQMISQFEV